MGGPLTFGFFALAHAFFAISALSFAGAMPVAAICLFIVEAITAYDNMIVATGRQIGIGKHALKLNRMRFLLHACLIGFLIPVYVGIAAWLNVAPFNGALAIPAAFAVTALIAVLGYLIQYRSLGPIMPINYYGCLRYAAAVDERRKWPGYDYSEAELSSKAVPPLTAIITVLLALLISFWTGWSAGMWLPFAVTAIMLVAASFPTRSWGPLVTSILEVFFSGGLVASLWLLSSGMLRAV